MDTQAIARCLKNTYMNYVYVLHLYGMQMMEIATIFALSNHPAS